MDDIIQRHRCGRKTIALSQRAFPFTAREWKTKTEAAHEEEREQDF
jgi:hypothetical protein